MNREMCPVGLPCQRLMRGSVGVTDAQPPRLNTMIYKNAVVDQGSRRLMPPFSAPRGNAGAPAPVQR